MDGAAGSPSYAFSSPAGHVTTTTTASPTVPLSKRTSSRRALSRLYLDGVGPTPETPSSNRRSSKKGKQPAYNHPSVPSRSDQLRREQRAAADSHRHSHGLSWSSTTRDSVVDNLLLSLDNLPSQHPPPGIDDVRDDDFDREKYRMPDLPQLPVLLSSKHDPRARGHTYSSSLSSGYDGYGTVAADSPSSKYSQSTKGRRSNSSSNFGLNGSIAGKAQSARKMHGIGRVASDTQHNVANGGNGKNASGDIDSVENGRSTGLENTKMNVNGRRSLSLDQIDQLFTRASDAPSVIGRGRPVPSAYSMFEGDYDAAPEPAIPAGPRKKDNPKSKGAVFVDPAPSENVRKVNTQSDLRNTSRSIPTIPQHVQEQATDFVRLNSMRGTPSLQLPYDNNTPTASPGTKAARRKDVPSPNRERPGFFRRVFGSASRAALDSQETLNYVENGVSPSRSPSNGPATTLRQPLQPSHQAPTLNKKPSSFFRRRKKSVSEDAPVPPLPPSSNLKAPVNPPLPSPSVSSLRQVMDSYLSKDDAAAATDAVARDRAIPVAKYDDSSRPTTNESAGDSDLDMFHSGYTPPPDASLGRRNPLDRMQSRSSREMQNRKIEGSPRLKVKKRKPDAVDPKQQQPQYPRGSSFLHDASREQSTATIGEHFTPPIDQSRISPLTDFAPKDAQSQDDERPVSRASTGDRIIASRAGDLDEPFSPMRSFSDGADVSTHEEGWVVMHRPSGDPHTRPGSKRSDRLFLQPTQSEESTTESKETVTPLADSVSESRRTSLSFPAMHTAATSAVPSITSPNVYYSATSLPLPSVRVDGRDPPRRSTDTETAKSPATIIDATAEYKERARKIYEGHEDDVAKLEAASWLGAKTTLSTKTLQAYMQLFDFTGMNILGALRTLCGKLLLKGETQQFDRIITALSARWCACNSHHGFKAQDVVHTISYSIILLNTDLHLADIGEKMSKNAYVKNTLPTIRRVVADAVPNAFGDNSIGPIPSASSKPFLPWTDSLPSISASPATQQQGTSGERTSFEQQRPNASKRLSIRPGVFRAESDGWTPDSAASSSSNALVDQPWTGTMRAWEFEVETVLKSFYSSIKSEPLPLMGATTSDTQPADRTLSVANFSSSLRRSGSVVSKTPSDHMSSRSKPGFRAMTMSWQNRANRSRPKLYPASTIGSSRTSFDDGNSVFSPAVSSKNSFAKTLTSASVNSLSYRTSPTSADYKHSIGFANALSQAIIREESQSTYTGDTESLSVPGGLLEDDALTLEGAPWAKEGLVKHKHHLEQPDRKAKDRNWNDCFAVISKGRLTLFAFNTSSTKSQSTGRRALQKHSAGKTGSVTATKVGGGDWMENAEQLDVFILRQTIASTLPPPGYSKTRPHVWALSLPSGAVHLFQVGTPEIAQEFMTSANYWSARLSKEPLSGGVSNIEYGWSDQIINPALLDRSESLSSPPRSLANHNRGHMHSSSGSTHVPGQGSVNLPRPSFQSSLRGSFDTGFGSVRTRAHSDKVQIAEWHPPTQSMMASQLLEVDQLKALTTYVNFVESELAKHNELKHGIELAVSLQPLPAAQSYQTLVRYG